MNAVNKLIPMTILSFSYAHASTDVYQTNNSNYDSSFFDSEVDEKTLISLNSTVEFSDNLYQRSSNKKRGVKTINGFSINYLMGRKENKYSIQYDTSYTNYGEEDIDDKLNWVGKATLYQQVFTSDLFIDASHLRHRYLLDSGGSNLPSNQGNRDIFTIKPTYRYTFTERNGAKLSYAFKQAKYSDSPGQDTERTTPEVSLFHKLSPLASVDLNSSYSSVKFTESGYTYDKWSNNVSYKRKLAEHSYFIKFGVSEIKEDNRSISQPIYIAKYQLNSNHFLAGIIALKELTDNSLGLEIGVDEDSESNNDSPEVIDRDRVEIYHKYNIPKFIFSHETKLYFDQESTKIVFNGLLEDSKNYTRGIISTFSLQQTPKLMTDLVIHYKNSDYAQESKNTRWIIDLNTKYQFSKQVSLSFGINYIDNSSKISPLSSYDEMRLRSQLTFTY